MIDKPSLSIEDYEICNKLKSMRFSGMAEALEAVLADPNAELLPFREKIQRIVDAEWNLRYTKKLNRFIKKATLKYPAADLDDTIYHPERQLDAHIIEELSKCDTIVLDKTGTLTVGVPKVVLAQSVVDAYSDEEIYAFAAGAEKKSEHPLGKAIIRCFKSDIGEEIADAGEFAMIPGQGVKADINGRTVCAGNDKLMIKEKIQITERVRNLAKKQIEKGTSIIYVAVDGTLCGLLALADSLRDESAGMIRRLVEIGIVPVLITGDNKEAANQIAGEVGISDVHANCLPEDKLGIIDTYQKNQELVCMIGDGVNDAPALKIAAVGIAMGGVGSDIAVDAADIALVDDEVRELPHLFSLSHRMMTKIKFNLSFSMLLNFVAIVLAMTGILNPVVGALVHNAGSVLVITNSAFLLNWRKKVQ